MQGRRLAAQGHVAWLRWWETRGRDDRGDVPGWVLVTMMTAGLVAGLWAIAGNTLGDLFRDAVNGVSAP
ncbi:hypothetical protein GCM10027446_15390 [Angustibacter peucedani]